MLVMIGYIFMFKMVKKMQNSGYEIVAGLTRPLRVFCSFLRIQMVSLRGVEWVHGLFLFPLVLGKM